MSLASSDENFRIVKDPVHDLIKLSPLVSALVDTRQFQRLRAIKQLGVSYYIWPGASHNRFEHCLGVAHLARKMVEGLRTRQPELGITDRDVRCVEIAGLCHDLGHGPWSHVWDGHFIPAALGKDTHWSHEDASEMMFDSLLDKNEIEFPEDERNFVKDLIKGAPNLSKDHFPPEKPFLFEIVANKRNGIDVDKFDYIARDCRAVGETTGPSSPSLLIEAARVINNEICYNIKTANALYEMCHTRYKLHKQIYNHKTARAIEYMVVDALIAAEAKMRIAEQIRDPERYVFLTDDIMPRIESTTDEHLAESRKVFDRIRTRDLYRCVTWKAFEWDVKDQVLAHVTPEKILDRAKELYRSHVPVRQSDGTPVDFSRLTPSMVEALTPRDIVMDHTTLHYGMKEKNPVDFIHFYGKHNPNESFSAETGDYATIRPKYFAETLLRIYVKNPDHFSLIQAGYNKLMEELDSQSNREDSPDVLTPPASEAPSTPRISPNNPPTRTASLTSIPLASPENSFSSLATVVPSIVDPSPVVGKQGRKTKKTPFAENKFARVPRDFVPESPAQKHRKVKQNGDTPNSALATPTAPSLQESPLLGRSGGVTLGSARALYRAGSPTPTKTGVPTTDEMDNHPSLGELAAPATASEHETRSKGRRKRADEDGGSPVSKKKKVH